MPGAQHSAHLMPQPNTFYFLMNSTNMYWVVNSEEAQVLPIICPSREKAHFRMQDKIHN